MKFTKILAVVFAASALLASCVKETGNQDGNSVGNPKGEAYIKIDFEGTASPDTKAFDGADLGVTLKDATIFIISKTGAIMDKKYISSVGSPAITEWKTTTDSKYVVVLGNLGSDLTAGAAAFGTAVTTIDALKTVAYTLDQMAVSLSNAANARILLHGQSGDFDWSTAGNSSTDPTKPLVATSVMVHPVPARLDVTIKNQMTGTGNYADYISIEGVAILYSAQKNYVVPTVGTDRTIAANYIYAPLQANLTPYYFSGYDPSLTTDSWSVLQKATVDQNFIATGATLSYLNKTWSASSPTGTDFTETFYAIPGNVANTWDDNTVPYTTVAIYGTFDADGTGTAHTPQRRFWYLHMSPNDGGANGEVLKNGKQYNVAINLKGDWTNGGGGGEDPDEPSVDGYMTVTITSNKWDTKVQINKDIQ